MLTAAKWTTVGIVLLLIPAMALWIRQGYRNIEFLQRFSSRANRASGDGQGLKGGAEAIAKWEFLIVIEWVTLGAVVLIGIFAFLAGAGRPWARIVCTLLMVFPIGVVVYGVVDDDSAESLWALVFLVPFVVPVLMWWLPGTSRGIRAKAASRMPSPVPPVPQHRY
jgi:hypothetical protein